MPQTQLISWHFPNPKSKHKAPDQMPNLYAHNKGQKDHWLYLAHVLGLRHNFVKYLHFDHKMSEIVSLLELQG